MRCHECGADVGEGQRFCQDCGASLRGVADVTGELQAVPPITISTAPTLSPPTSPAQPPPTTPAQPPPTTPTAPAPPTPTRPPPASSPARLPPPPARATSSTDDTTVLPVDPWSPTARQHQQHQPASAARAADTTGRLPVQYAPAGGDWSTGRSAGVTVGELDGGARRFRFRPLLVLVVLTAVGAVTAVVANLITIAPDAGATAGFEIGDWKVNDFGTNNALAALVPAAAMVVGGLASGFGARWGAGLAGGAGAALAGWAALLIGLAEWPIVVAERSGQIVTITRDVGYWAVAGTGVAGLIVLLVSLASAGRDGHAGLDPWIAALGAASFLLAAGGPLLPQRDVGFEANYTSTTVDLPTAFFAGRMVQLGLFALCGVVGFLMVRRFGLGLAIGGALAAGWMLVTAATNQTDSPIGPAYANPGAIDLQPHAVTIVGMAMVGFFTLVAVVMALLDSDR